MNNSDEEKKAIEIVKCITEDDLLNYWEGPEEPYNAIQIVLNLIQKQEKIIDKFSKALVNCVGTCPIDYNDDFENDCENCQDTLEKCWIEFFKKEVEKNVKNV